LSALRECALAAADALESARDELGRLDSAAGDGDHGMTMTAAARAVRSALDASPNLDGADLLTRLAAAAGSVGGASGPLYASALLAAATTVRQIGSAPPNVILVAQCAEAAEHAIRKLGGAAPGDKTMLDALDPAVRALRKTSSQEIGQALAEAAAAARRGAESTAQMVARAGRARALGERSLGSADPGATSLAVILEGAASACRGRPQR
jgi:phosphoenolpyruvate---glycerone phosphotransferase subunit DhaL